MPLYNPPATQTSPWLSTLIAPTGATGETFPRVIAAASSGVPTSGTLQVNAIGLPAGVPVSNITFCTGAQAKTGGTHGWYVLLDSGLVVRAVSADQTDAATVWGAANTAYTLSVSAAAYTTTYTGLYYIGVMVAESAGQMPNFVSTNALVNPLGPTVPILGGSSSTGQTTPPATGTTMTAVSGAGKHYYGYTS